MLDDSYVYVFVRQDLSIPAQLVAVSHASLHMAALYIRDEGTPNIVVIGCPHSQAMKRVLDKLTNHQIPRFVWSDPDSQDGVTAVATVPLSREQKSVLGNYRLYSPGPSQEACRLTADGRANAGVAQLREHSVSNREVAGENPATGSINCC